MTFWRIAGARLENGCAAVVRNGFQPGREMLKGLGSVQVPIPKARSRAAEPALFHSRLVPPSVRPVENVDAVLPCRYLHGVSTGNTQEALAALVGPQTAGLSAPAVARPTGVWMETYRRLRRAKLGQDRLAYLWVDGIDSGVRAENGRSCAPVVIGVNERGEKKLLALADGLRESKQSCREVLLAFNGRVLTGMSAKKNWRSLRDFQWLAKVISEATSHDGIDVK
ncbi:MAG: transposase [Casimicrobiaceae bacterium]